MKTTQFTASNDLYGSFCRVRVTLQSDDKRIQDAINEGASWSTAYFAVGDVFTCGSWIPSSALETMAEKVAQDVRDEQKTQHNRVRGWMTALGAVGGTVGGGYLGAGIQNGSVFGGLTGLNNSKAKPDVDNKKLCQNFAIRAKTSLDSVLGVKVGTTTEPNITDALADAKYAAEMAVDYAENLADIKDDPILGRIDSTRTSVDTNLFTKANTGNWNWTAGEKEKVEGLRTDVEALEERCKSSTGESESNGKNKQWIGSTIGAVVGGVGGGILLNKITGDIQETMRDADAKAAYEEFMNQIGRHIYCYIGGEEAGTYGEMVQPYVE